MDEDLSCNWNDANIKHIASHDIRPAEVEEVLASEAMDVGYELVNGEEPWTSVGQTSAMRRLVVVWTMRGELARPVTAFEAGKKLAAEYIRQKGDEAWRP